jgi:RecQ family ATP-dependent DNA helicase
MADQVTHLQNDSIVPATFINSDLSKAEKDLRYKTLERGLWKLLYLSPERFDQDRIRDRLEVERLMSMHPAYLVIDEAHCLPYWGESFRPSYKKLGQARHRMGEPPVLCFTATAGPQTQSELLSLLEIPDADIFYRNVDRPNIALLRAFIPSAERRHKTMARLIQQCTGKTLIFVPTRRIGEEVQQGLATSGLNVPFFYGALDNLKRSNIQGRFCGQLAPELNTVICTKAFGMGIDVPNIRLVIHEGQPDSPEEYWQEIGRAGRDGQPATAVLFKRDDDVAIQRFMVEKEPVQGSLFPEDENGTGRERQLKAIETLDRMIKNKHRCFRRQLLEYLGVVDRKPQRSFGMRIVEWLFGTRNSQPKAKFCCDFCNPEETRRFFLGERAVSRAKPTLDN